jgi:hypothetical protein
MSELSLNVQPGIAAARGHASRNLGWPRLAVILQATRSPVRREMRFFS